MYDKFIDVFFLIVINWKYFKCLIVGDMLNKVVGWLYEEMFCIYYEWLCMFIFDCFLYYCYIEKMFMK